MLTYPICGLVRCCFRLRFLLLCWGAECGCRQPVRSSSCFDAGVRDVGVARRCSFVAGFHLSFGVEVQTMDVTRRCGVWLMGLR